MTEACRRRAGRPVGRAPTLRATIPPVDPDVKYLFRWH
jgi:hypothetical protein